LLTAGGGSFVCEEFLLFFETLCEAQVEAQRP
jgi:hypothetical protein